ncbi:DUF3344 domain-containing protein [Streptomyces sp. NPDC007088]|uniref:DUF3344 domain-containing protein n=1 Tax=Streptomyces sp. NPDC007088 TaxID=3364773 RepID=UPI0036921839
MRSPRHLSAALRHGTVCVLAALALLAGVPASGASAPARPAAPAAPGPDREAAALPVAQRWSAVLRGGFVRAANTAVTCRGAVTPGVPSCAAAARPVSAGGPGRGAAAPVSNGDYSLLYADVDRDPHTYNSSRARLRVPEGARIRYARLYWGGNLRVGERKPPKDNARVLFAEPGGAYRALRADTVTGHRVAGGADAFQSSADVTRLVRAAGPGLYTVAQINVARGNSPTGGWGGWTLVAAYERKSEPLRRLSLWDGFRTLRADERDRRSLSVGLPALRVPAGARGSAGIVAYDGDRGLDGDSVTVRTGNAPAVPLGDAANPTADVFNSTVSEGGAERAGDRVPGPPNTFGYDSDVLDLGRALRSGGTGLRVRFTALRDSLWLGALFLQTDAGSRTAGGGSGG